MRSRKMTYRDRSPLRRRRDNNDSRRPDHYHNRRGVADDEDEPRYNDRSPLPRREVRRLSSEDRFNDQSPRPLRPVRRLGSPPESGRIVFRGGRSNSPPPQNDINRGGYLRRFDGDKDDDGIVGARGSVRQQQQQPWDRSELDEKVSQRGGLSMDYRHVNDEVNRSSLKQVGESENSMQRFRHEKEYQGIGSSSFDGGKSMLVPKPMYFEDGTVRTFFALPPEGSKNRDFLASSSGMTNVGLHKDEELRYRDQIHSMKMPMRETFGEAKPIYDEQHYSVQMHPSRVQTRESYDEELKPVLYTRDAAYPVVPVSQSKTFSTSSLSFGKEDGVGSRLPVEGYGKGVGNYVESLGRDANITASHSDPTRDEKDPVYYQRGVRSPLRHEHQDYYHPELGRRKIIDSGYLGDELYRKMPSATQGDYRNRELLKPSYMDPDPVDEFYREMPPTTQRDYHNRELSRPSYVDLDFGRSHRSTRESDLLDHYTVRGEPVSDYNNIKRAPLVPMQDRDFLGSGSSHLEIGTRISGGRKLTSLEQDYAFEREAISRSYRERLEKATPEFESDIHDINLSPRRRLRVQELDNYDSSERMLQRDYIMEEEMSRRYPGSTLSSGRIISRRIQEPTGSDIQGDGANPGRLSLSARLNFDRHQYRKGGKPFKRLTTIGASSSDRFSDHAQQRTGGHVSIKKRLRSGPFNSHHLDERMDSHKGLKSKRRALNNPFDSPGASNGDAVEDAFTLKSDVPEDSEEFKLLVQRAFLRFSKQLNENPSQRKRYLEQGKCRVLCSVCGSLSKEFPDTQSLVRHAFTSLKVGLRADHLGLHKALCVLMGWKSSEVPDGRWSLQVLPEAQALSLKEDLVLWPPQVIIHNSSILNENPDERKVIKIEEMEGMLKDMGYGEGKTKVCRGKPANQSIMVVTFNSTFSGLQEAQRLHNYYADKKRGREDFLRINSKSGGKSEEAHGELAKNVGQDVLYGYIGTAEDLDKLDFGSKSKCIVKSKKDIQAIAGAPLETD
ncbi:hypothetical protein MKX03_002624 [Papaver bracteatum]|nr:hypothetical protein MKX03_002624 [Papaver bracteatum]